MITGFVKTSDGKTYFFENAKTKDEGKMVIGWKFQNLKNNINNNEFDRKNRDVVDDSTKVET